MGQDVWPQLELSIEVMHTLMNDLEAKFLNEQDKRANIKSYC
jgi:hypothetical protein